MKTVFMYAGQGSQKAGMGKDLYESFPEYREVIDALSLGERVKELMHDAPLEVLSKTENTQPAMAAFAAGVTAILSRHQIQADAALGLSLGEYGALFAAGVFDADTYVNLTAYRGQFMSEAAAKAPVCCMSAILGLDAETVSEGCAACQDKGFVTVANYNCPGQYVLCGDEAAVEATEAYLKEKGARRCMRLNVSGPFHTKYMETAAEKLKAYLDSLTLQTPKLDVIMNVTGDYYHKGDDLRALLEQQVKSSVRFEASVRKLIADGYDHFVEIGPGNVLSGFVKKTAKDMGADVMISQLESADSIKKYLEFRKEV